MPQLLDHWLEIGCDYHLIFDDQDIHVRSRLSIPVMLG